MQTSDTRTANLRLCVAVVLAGQRNCLFHDIVSTLRLQVALHDASPCSRPGTHNTARRDASTPFGETCFHELNGCEHHYRASPGNRHLTGHPFARRFLADLRDARANLLRERIVDQLGVGDACTFNCGHHVTNRPQLGDKRRVAAAETRWVRYLSDHSPTK